MKNFTKIFAAILFAAYTILTPLANAENLTYEIIEPPVVEYVATLPTAKGEYKSRQRPILLQGAMTAEVGKLIKALKNPVVYKYMDYLFVAGMYKNYPVVVSRTEIGLANAGASTALAIEHFKPIAIINQGTAGAYAPNLHLYDILIGEKSLNYSAYYEEYSQVGDFDITAQHLRGSYALNRETGYFERIPEFIPDEKLLQIAKDTAASHKSYNVSYGTIGSADSWNNALDHINFLCDTYGIVCEEMETSAAAQICYTQEVPFIGIRVISDNTVIGEKFDVGTALKGQDFVLLVTRNLITAIKGGKF